MDKVLSGYINPDCSTIIDKYMRIVDSSNIIDEYTIEGFFLYICLSCNFRMEINIEDLWMDGDVRCYKHDRTLGYKYYYNCDNCAYKNYFNLELKCKNCLSIDNGNSEIECRCFRREYNCYKCYTYYCQDCMDKQYYCRYYYDYNIHQSSKSLLFCTYCHN